MTRTELMEKAHAIMTKTSTRQTQLASCTARYINGTIEGIGSVVVLQSYATAVAIYRVNTGTLYVFDSYSHTTASHVQKFAKLMDVNRITYLYRRSDRVIEQGVFKYANTYKLTAQQFREVEALDFETYIGGSRK